MARLEDLEGVAVALDSVIFIDVLEDRIEKVKEYTFKLDDSLGQFVDHCQDYGFQDSRELVMAALKRLRSALESSKLEESAALYAQIYEEEPELQALTEAGLEEWPKE